MVCVLVGVVSVFVFVGDVCGCGCRDGRRDVHICVYGCMAVLLFVVVLCVC